MTKEEIQELIKTEVAKKLTEEKKRLAREVRMSLEGTGEFAGSYRVMRIFDTWAAR